MNATPYHSADNGFACAAAGRGITEALQEHLNVIVRNEELEIEISHSQIQAEINDLVEDKERLEQQKLDRQESIHALGEELAEQDIKLSELNAKLENPLNVDETPPSPRIEELKKEIEENTLELGEKKVAQAKLETDLEAPTEVELNPSSVGAAQVSSKRRLSIPEWILAGLFTVVVLGLAFYLIIFYASVGDRTFTEGIGTVAEKRHIIIPKAFFKAWESPKNWFVITFPLPFLVLAFLVYFFHEHKKWWMFAGLLVATFSIDFIIAIKISEQMHKFTKGEDVPYKVMENWIEVSSVLFLGFGVSLLLGFGLLSVMKIWRGEKPHQDESERLERQKRFEQNDRLVQLNALTTETQHLETKINTLDQEKENYGKHIEETSKQEIRVKIARLNTEKGNLQSQINDLNEQVESFQKEINQCETEIESLLKRQRSKVIDLKKLEANANEFVSGWCRYVAQSRNELPADVTSQIKDIQSLANETLETYKASLPEI